MSSLVTLTAKFYDRSGRYLINLNVQSRYKDSSRANSQKTDSNGSFIFQASPNRVVEILVKPPNAENYTVLKTINSLIESSSKSPIIVRLPKTLEEYQQKILPQSGNGTVATLFKIVDSNGKIMTNFPIKSRPKGRTLSYERYTNQEGIVEVISSPNRDIEILVLNSNDQFILRDSVNSKNGSIQPIIIKLNDSYEKFRSTTTLHLLDRDGSDFVVQNTKVEMLLVRSGQKQILSISNGKMPLVAMVGQQLRFTVFKPDGKALQPVDYFAKRIKENPVELHLDVDVTNGDTAQGDPNIGKDLKEGECTCNRDITTDEFKKITNSSTALGFLKDLNEQFRKLNMNNCLEKAHFIAHTLHETASYRLLEEGLGGKPESSVYDGYKGRGLMQITYKSNYEGYGKAVNEDFTGSNKHRITKEKKHAVGSAVWYWHHSKAGNLTPHAIKNDLIATCALINGGYNGFDDRLSYYKKAVDAFKISKCTNLDQKIINRLDDYTSFEKSYIYSNKAGESFGWGLWNDPQANKKGKTKNVEEAKKGYARFLEMSKEQTYPFGTLKDNKGNTISRKRYGYSADAAKSFAGKRLKEL